MIEAALVVVLASCILAWVLVPVFRGPRAMGDPGPPSDDAEAARKAAALDAIVDLEEDRAVGKLTKADFEALRADYEAEALAALRELDAGGGSRGVDDELEAEIAAARRELTCPRCGRARTEGQMCPQCGE